MDPTKGVIDNSTYSTYQICPRKAFYRQMLNLVPIGFTTATSFGSAIHKALEFIHTHRELSLPEQVMGGFTEFCKIYPTQVEDYRTREFGLKIIKAYVTQYQRDSFKIVNKPEQGFAFLLNSTYTLVGRFDCVIEYLDAPGLWVFDHKTTSRMGKDWWEQWRMDTSLDVYILAAQSLLSQPVLGMTINGIGTGKTAHDGPAKSAEHLGRRNYTRSQQRLSEEVDNICRVMDRIVKHSPIDPHDWEQRKCNCSWKYGLCPYMNLCDFGQDQWDSLMGQFKVEVWEPYITEEI